MRRNNPCLLVGMALLLSGCMVPAGSDHERPAPTLVVARAGDLAVLSWQSQPDSMYTVLFSDAIPAQWQPLAGGSRLRGNGRELRMEDPVPYGKPRQYRLLIEMANR
jgi:hypothetical protein